jgi:IMP cyclohydrolase
MNSVYDLNNLNELLKNNPYPGRGIVVGKSGDGKNAVFAYFIMGRSENSRNRVFTVKDRTLYTEPYDFSKVEDPSLIIYAAMREYDNKIMVTNGDQTDTTYKFLKMGKTSRDGLHTRAFEPDAPNLTPRISAVLDFSGGDFTYEMSILKSADAVGSYCNRYFYEYHALCGVGHFIHTYVTDGNPIPTFMGEPERVEIPSDIDEFSAGIWENLNENNKISLYVSFVNLESGEKETRIINKNK